MAMFRRNPLSVQLQMQPSPERSIFIQQLLARALQNNGRGSRSVAESLDIASAPIVAALLNNMNNKAQAQQQGKQTELASQLIRGRQQAAPTIEDPAGGPSTSYPVPYSSNDPRQQALASILAQNPQAMGAMALQQAMPQQMKRPEPLSTAGKVLADAASGAIPQDLASTLTNIETKTDPGTIKAQQLAQAAAEQSRKTALDTQVNQINDDLYKQSAPFLTQRSAVSRIRASSQDPSPAGDLSMIFSYMKLLDPTSVVRESEYATAENARSVPETIRSLYNRVISGEKLTDTQRADFSNRSERIFASARQDQIDLNERFMKRAKNSGIPENTFRSSLIAPDPATPTPTDFSKMTDEQLRKLAGGQ